MEQIKIDITSITLEDFSADMRLQLDISIPHEISTVLGDMEKYEIDLIIHSIADEARGKIIDHLRKENCIPEDESDK